MKKIFTLLILLATVFAVAEQTVQVDGEEIRLQFENIIIKKLSFIDGDEIIINGKTKNVDFKVEENLLLITAESEENIKLELPAAKKYVYEMEDGVVHFDQEQVLVTKNDGEVIQFKDGNLLVLDGEETRVEIGKDGIFVLEDDQKVEINSQGIIIDSDSEYKELTGFWGKLLGGFIKMVVKGSVSMIGKNPEVIMKSIINEENDEYYDYDISFLGINKDDGDGFGRKYSDEVKLTHQAQAGQKLNVMNRNGSITVKSWDQDVIEINALKQSGKSKEELEKVEIVIYEMDGVTVESKFIDQMAKVSVKYEIFIPKDVLIGELNSSNGSLKLSDCRGNSVLRSSNGSIEVSDFEGDVKARTSNGRIEVINLKGMLDAITSNGSIGLSGITGPVEIQSSNGRLEIENCPVLKKAITSNGSIEVEILQMNDDVTLSTSNGRISTYINPDLNIEVAAITSNSKIEIEDLSVQIQNFSSNNLSGILGTGGPMLNLKTSNSKIYLRKISG